MGSSKMENMDDLKSRMEDSKTEPDEICRGIENIKSFSDGIQTSQKELQTMFVDIEKFLQDITISPPKQASDVQQLKDELKQASERMKYYKKFLDDCYTTISDSRINLHERGEPVDKRENAGRGTCDSGVYSVGSQVLSTTIDPRTLSSSNMLVAQASDDIEEPSSTGTEHDERAELPTGGETEA